MAREPYPSETADRFIVRLPDGMRDRIRAHADANNRSMNAEVVFLLEAALWEADMARMQSGQEPLRPMSESDMATLTFYRDLNAKAAARKTPHPDPNLQFENAPLLSVGADVTEQIVERVLRKLLQDGKLKDSTPD